jgi:hypothetical protein
LCAVDDLGLGDVGDGAGLIGREIVVVNNEPRVLLHGGDGNVLKLAAAHDVQRVGLGAILNDTIRHLDIRAPGQLRELVHGVLRVKGAFLSGSDAYEHRAIFRIAHDFGACLLGKLVFYRVDETGEISRQHTDV